MERRCFVIIWASVILNAVFIFSSDWIQVSRLAVFFICGVNMTLFISIHYFLKSVTRHLDAAIVEGSASTTAKYSIRTYLAHAKEFEREAKAVFAAIEDIGDERFSTLIAKIKSKEIQSSLTLANQKIIALRKQEQERNWLTQGVASIAGIKQKGNDATVYAEHVLNVVVKYLNANQGGLFLLKSEADGNRHLDLIASYAYGRRKYIEKRVDPGQGLVGQVLLDQQKIYLTDVPKDYVKITSGLGEALPACICILPLVFDNKVFGVLELAAFQKFESIEMEYLEKISETIGYNLATMESHRQTETLLEDSQKMAQEFKSQEEELRQNMEELQATQEQMLRKEQEMNAVLSSLATVELDDNGIIIHANEIFLAVTGFKTQDVLGRPYKQIIPKNGNDVLQYEMMLASILSGQTFSGEFRILNHSQKEIWMAGNFTPILNGKNKLAKIMIVSIFITQDKEKLSELQEMIGALKCCFPMAEINPDISFKTANDLFLSEVGIRRLELKRSSPKSFLEEDSFRKLEKHIMESQQSPDNLILNIQSKHGETKRFNSTLINIHHASASRRKGLLILRNPV